MSRGRKPGSDGPGSDAAPAPASAPSPWSDAELLAGVRRRDPGALGRFFDLAFPYVYNLAYRFTRHRETAEDITQEVFIKVHGAADRLATDRSAKPWLTAITVNACRDEARRRSARPEDPVDAAAIGRDFAASGTPEADLIARERNDRLERALRKLDVDSRLIVLLHDYCDRPHEEIAELLQFTHDAVRKRHSRALKRLAELVQDEGS